MATVSTKEIKTRIRSMESTKQITRAMEMVASSKLRHAQAKALAARPYYELLLETVKEIVQGGNAQDSPYLMQRPVKRCAYVVIAGDRGLAGGYNSNLLKMAYTHMENVEKVIFPVGKKAMDFFAARQVPILTGGGMEAASMSVGDCFSVAKHLCKAYCTGEIDGVYVVYTKFVSVLSQVPDILSLLPLIPETGPLSNTQMIYEPDCATVLETIIPEYLGGVLYGSLCESRAAEQAARRTAMNSATQNAEEMISELSLKYNQARQAAITQEITEIVAGSQ